MNIETWEQRWKKKRAPEHGLTRYKDYGCKCEICTLANREAIKRYRSKYGIRRTKAQKKAERKYERKRQLKAQIRRRAAIEMRNQVGLRGKVLNVRRHFISE